VGDREGAEDALEHGWTSKARRLKLVALQGQPFQHGVFVRTTSVANTEATRAFHLQVNCSKVANAVPEASARFGPSARRGDPNSR
jgi:hypothetical protein